MPGNFQNRHRFCALLSLICRKTYTYFLMYLIESSLCFKFRWEVHLYVASRTSNGDNLVDLTLFAWIILKAKQALKHVPGNQSVELNQPWIFGTDRFSVSLIQRWNDSLQLNVWFKINLKTNILFINLLVKPRFRWKKLKWVDFSKATVAPSAVRRQARRHRTNL